MLCSGLVGSCSQNVMYTYVSLSFLYTSLIVTALNGKKTESEEERARRLMWKLTKTESQNAPTTPWSPSQDWSAWEGWLAKQRMAISENDHILAFGEVIETLLTFWNVLPFFSHFACCTWPTVLPCLLTVMYTCRLLVQRSLRCMCTRHTLQIRTTSI